MVIWKAAMAPEVVDRTHFIDPVLNEWLLADEVLDLVEPVIGPDIALFASSFINKGPSVGTKSVPWHGDAVFWTELAEDITAVTVWLAIDPATVDNGCMRVIPGTHRDRELEHVRSTTGLEEKIFHREVNPELIDESKAVDCILEDHCSLHDAYLIHGSHLGGSKRRVGFQMRYMPTTVKGTDYLGQQMYLAQGKDHAGNDYGDPTKVNESGCRRIPSRGISLKPPSRTAPEPICAEARLDQGDGRRVGRDH